MNKRLLLTLLIVLSVVLSVSAVSASDVNVEDSYAANLVDDTLDVSVSNNGVGSSDIAVSSDSNVDNSSSKVSLSSEEVLESDNSNTLSTNTEITNDDNNVGSAAYSDEKAVGASSKTVTKGYFLFGADMKSVNLNTLASYGTTDIFLNYYAIEKYGQSAVQSWIASANKLGINVHIWMQVFYDNGKWVNPVSNGKYNTAFCNSKIAEAQKYAKIKGVSGIVLDYLRYPGTAYKTSGGTDAISKFTKLVTDAIHKINSALIVSATLMPETTSSKYYYGQDYAAISSYVDAVVPMVYKGNYKKTTSWITTTTKWYVDNSKGAKVWAALQTYNSDSNVVKLSASALNTDVKNAVSGGANGVFLFRYGVTNLVNFKNVIGSSSVSVSTTTSSVSSISINDILAGANALKTFYAKNKRMPGNVNANGKIFTLPEFLYLMSQALYQLGNSNTKDVACLSGVGAAPSPSGDKINAQLKRADYLTVAKNLAEFYKKNKRAPNYVSSAVGKINYTTLCDSFSRILVFYKDNNKFLANYVTISQTATKNTNPSTKPTSLSVNDILAGANALKNYYSSNKKLPSGVTIAKYTFTMPEFLYLMSQALYQLGNSNTKAVACLYGVGAAPSPSGDKINVQLKKADYLTVAKNLADFIKKNNRAPNYVSSAAGKINYTTLCDSISRGLAFYKNNNNVLPNYVTISQTATNSNPSKKPASVSINDILTGSNTLKNYYSSNKKLPSSVTVAGYAFTMPEFLYLMSQATYQLGNSNTNAIACLYGVKAPSSSSGDKINAQLKKVSYLTAAKNLAAYIVNHKCAPIYVSTSVGKVSYIESCDAFARILAFYKNNNKYMPDYVTIGSGSSSSSSYSVGGVNVKNTITNLSPYYQATKNCQVNNSAIKSLVNSLTKGLTSDKEKATVIYNYVRDKVSYSFYYDTKKGAVGTLNAKSGNCVDQAHLVVAMFRSAGLAARYEHGTCRFTSATYGHVWAQVLIDNVWVVADPTSTRNSFGVVKNWNTNSYTHKAYYSSLPF